MAYRTLPPWKPGDIITAEKLEIMQSLLQKHDRFLGGSGDDSIDTPGGTAHRQRSATRIKWVRLTEWIGPPNLADPSDYSNFFDVEGVVQHYNLTDHVFEDTDETVDYIAEPSGLLIYPEDAIIPVLADWSGNLVPLSGHAVSLIVKAGANIDAIDNVTPGTGEAAVWVLSVGDLVETDPVVTLQIYNASSSAISSGDLVLVHFDGVAWWVGTSGAPQKLVKTTTTHTPGSTHDVNAWNGPGGSEVVSSPLETFTATNRTSVSIPADKFCLATKVGDVWYIEPWEC